MDETKFQEAYWQATAVALGFKNIEELVAAVPDDLKPSYTLPRADRFNQSIALAMGYDTVADLIAANGMRGRKVTWVPDPVREDNDEGSKDA